MSRAACLVVVSKWHFTTRNLFVFGRRRKVRGREWIDDEDVSMVTKDDATKHCYLYSIASLMLMYLRLRQRFFGPKNRPNSDLKPTIWPDDFPWFDKE